MSGLFNSKFHMTGKASLRVLRFLISLQHNKLLFIQLLLFTLEVWKEKTVRKRLNRCYNVITGTCTNSATLNETINIYII